MYINVTRCLTTLLPLLCYYKSFERSSAKSGGTVPTGTSEDTVMTNFLNLTKELLSWRHRRVIKLANKIRHKFMWIYHCTYAAFLYSSVVRRKWKRSSLLKWYENLLGHSGDVQLVGEYVWSLAYLLRASALLWRNTHLPLSLLDSVMGHVRCIFYHQVV